MSTHAQPAGYIRGYNPVTDADAVVSLIAESFSLEKDSEGMRVLNQMRENARLARDNVWFSSLAASQPGYVWILDGKIVGNITIISFLERLRHIALIANVAVKSELRGHGIAAALTRQALRFTKAKRAAEVWLQVNDNNPSAKTLYQKFGFRETRTVNSWILKAQTPSPPAGSLPQGWAVRPRGLWDWSSHNRWLREIYPPDTRWYAMVDFSLFSPWSRLNPFRWDQAGKLSHFALSLDDELAGIASWQHGLPRQDLLWLAFGQTPTENERVRTLLGQLMNQRRDNHPVRLEYPVGRAEVALTDLGFELDRRFNWMKLS
jgi:GNAT superfamily N-acetyltransferase